MKNSTDFRSSEKKSALFKGTVKQSKTTNNLPQLERLDLELLYIESKDDEFYLKIC